MEIGAYTFHGLSDGGSVTGVETDRITHLFLREIAEPVKQFGEGGLVTVLNYNLRHEDIMRGCQHGN